MRRTGLRAPEAPSARIIATGRAMAIRRSTAGLARPALSAIDAPNEYPQSRIRAADACSARNATAAAASSTSPSPPSYSPLLEPTPRKLNRSVAYPSFHSASSAASTTLLYIDPPYIGCGWHTTAAPAGVPAGIAIRPSRRRSPQEKMTCFSVIVDGPGRENTELTHRPARHPANPAPA